jgi:hypothetical protein
MISKDKSLYFDCLDFTPVVSAEEMPSEVNKKNTPVHRSSRGAQRFLSPLRLNQTFCVKNRFCDAHHNNRTGVAVNKRHLSGNKARLFQNKAPLLQNKALIRFVEDW